MPGGVVLVAEDDDLLRELILEGLRSRGYVGCGASNGRDALAIAQSREIDLFILDRNMPELDGIGVLQTLRRHGKDAPAMFLTAVGEVNERIRGFDAGADDYMTKPFAIDELLARVRALVRRPRDIASDILKFEEISIDMLKREAFFRGNALDLTAQDVTLLSLFLRRPSQAFTREAILDQMGAEADITLAAVEHAVSRLRKKLERAGAPNVIMTVRGVGYRLANKV